MGIPYSESPTLSTTSPTTTTTRTTTTATTHSPDGPWREQARSSMLRSWFHGRRRQTASDDENLPEAVYPDASPHLRQSEHWRAENAPEAVEGSGILGVTSPPYSRYPGAAASPHSGSHYNGDYKTTAAAAAAADADEPRFFLPWSSIPPDADDADHPIARGQAQLPQIGVHSPASDMVSAMSPPRMYGYHTPGQMSHHGGPQVASYMGVMAGAGAASAALFGNMPIVGANPEVGTGPKPTPLYPFHPVSHWSPTTVGLGDTKAAMAATAAEMADEKSDADAKRNPRRRWLLLGLGALAALIVIGLAVGLGIALSQRNGDKGASSSSSGSQSPDSGPDSGGSPSGTGSTTLSAMSSLSQMASLNYTDSSGEQHRVVAWQDQYNHIVLSHYNPQASNWTIVNVTGALDVSVRPLPGTPIALNAKSYDPFGLAVAAEDQPFHLNVYYVDPEYNVYEIMTYDPSALAHWSLGQLSYTGLTIRPGSGLAAFWAPYWDSTYASMIFLQSQKEPDILRAYSFNATSAEWQDKGQVAALTGASQFAASPFYDAREADGSDNDPAVGDDSIRLHYTNGGTLYEVSPWGGPYGWTSDRTINTAPTTNASVATVGWGANRWTQLLTATVQADDSSVTLSWWGPTADGTGSEWHSGTPTYVGAKDGIMTASTDILALSMAQDMRVHVATRYDASTGSGGEILEFAIGEENPFEWTYKGKVGMQ